MTRNIVNNPQGWDASWGGGIADTRQHFARLPHLTLVERSTARVKCSAQEDNIMTLAGADPDCRYWGPAHQHQPHSFVLYLYQLLDYLYFRADQIGKTLFFENPCQ